jgi:hypothetical protein
MALSRPINPFFEPGAPPLPLPLLTSETDLFYSSNGDAPIIAHQEISRNRPLLASAIAGPVRTKLQENQRLHPYSKMKKVQIEAPPSTDSDASDSDDSVTSGATDHTDAKIPKPPGDCGRPRSGGYNIEDKLTSDITRWNTQSFKKLKVWNMPVLFFALYSSYLQKFVQKSAEVELDTSQNYSQQKRRHVNVVVNSVRVTITYYIYIS